MNIMSRRDEYRKSHKNPAELAERGRKILEAMDAGTYECDMNHIQHGMTPKELLDEMEKDSRGWFFDYPGEFEQFKYDVEHGII